MRGPRFVVGGHGLRREAIRAVDCYDALMIASREKLARLLSVGLAASAVGLTACDGAGEDPGPAQSSGPDLVQPATTEPPAEPPLEAAAGQALPGAATPADAPGAAQAATGPAQASFDAVLHDFGDIDDTRTVSCEFPFVNSGSTTLNVVEVKASCGCTTTELAQTRFEPGEGDVIRVDWKPKGHGSQSQTVNVITDSSVRRATRLTIRARVTQLVVPEPRTAEFGEVMTGTTQARQLLLTTSTGGMEVLSVQPAVAQLAATFVPNDGSQGASNDALLGAIDLRLVAPSRRGAFASSVVVTLRAPADETAPERVYELKIPVRASVYGAVQTEPDGFYVGHVLPGGSVDFDVRLRRPDGSAFGMTVTEVQNCTVEGMTLAATPGQDDQGHFVELSLEGEVGGYLGALRGQALLHTNIEGDTPFKLPIMGMVRE